MDCHYFAAGVCRSCALIETPYAVQLAEKETRCRTLLPGISGAAWLPAFASTEQGFRNRVKLVVGGRRGSVTLGILGPDGAGVDLRECAIQAPQIAAVLPAIAAFLDATGLPPYSVPKRQGELKYAHVTVSPAGELMLRFVVRSERALEVLRARLAELRSAVPAAEVISVNMLPEHKAVLEGEREELLVGESLAMALETGVTLHLQPRSFFQTNTGVACELYRQVAGWVAAAGPASVWDLYCGVGGFALHVAGAAGAAGASAASDAAAVVGVEVSAAAVDAARRSAREAGLAAGFVAADATEFALAAAPAERPELVIVNPPRRGIGRVLAEWCEGSGIPNIVYSSCNPESLARDLAAMPSYAVRAARVFDMFPHTTHLEVAVWLERRGSAGTVPGAIS